MSSRFDSKAEWLEADGLGGFASGTVSGIRTRRYHALLLAAMTPPTGRMVLVNGLDAWVETEAGTFPLSSQLYAPDVVHPDGHRRIQGFEYDPWPKWTFLLEDGTKIEQELFVPKDAPALAIAWRLIEERQGGAALFVRPFLSGRDYHALHHENPSFRFEPEREGCSVTWHPYPGLPGILALTNGKYLHQPDWYRNFFYEEERDRGLDFTEDLAAPGLFRWQLSRGEALLIFAVDGHAGSALSRKDSPQPSFEALRASELKRRRRFPSRLCLSADSYLVRRGRGKTIVAGYPWFTDWGRDTFIALRGLCLATGRFEEAREILLEWAGAVSEGMLPNRFPDSGEEPEFNSVDASLWYTIAAHELVKRSEPSPADRKVLDGAVQAILSGYARGTRYGIRLDEDGLLAAGEPGVQLTWMDAKAGDWVVTPRIGKPVEVQALWLNALKIGAALSPRWEGLCKRALCSFRSRFWNEKGGCLYDVVDVDHRPGTADAAFRPNQIFAVGGLPFPLLEGIQARRVVDAVEGRLLTPLGLRSLAPGEAGYRHHYQGGVWDRDGAYHQGTVWPWLIGPFVEAWVRVRGQSPEVKEAARRRFIEPLHRHLEGAGLGHISEIADAEPPHTPRGCPFQAWSLGELLRLELAVLQGG